MRPETKAALQHRAIKAYMNVLSEHGFTPEELVIAERIFIHAANDTLPPIEESTKEERLVGMKLAALPSSLADKMRPEHEDLELTGDILIEMLKENDFSAEDIAVAERLIKAPTQEDKYNPSPETRRLMGRIIELLERPKTETKEEVHCYWGPEVEA